MWRWLPAPLWPQLPRPHREMNNFQGLCGSGTDYALLCARDSVAGSHLGIGASRPHLTSTPALPNPTLLILLFSFRMKKAGIDLPLRQFQGTLDTLKCLRSSPVALLDLLPFPLTSRNPESSLNSVWLAVDTALSSLRVYLLCPLWDCKLSNRGLRAGISLWQCGLGWAGLWEAGLLAVTCLPL